MKKILICMAVMVFTAAIVFGCGKTSAQKDSSAAAGTSVIVTTHGTTAETAKETTGAADAEKTAGTTTTAQSAKNTVSGVVLDGTMIVITIQTEQGKTMSFATGDDTASTPIDKTGVKNGITIGHAVKITCKDTIDFSSADMKKNVVIKMEDTPVKCTSYDALNTAASVILSVESKDLRGLAGICSYPVYLGVKGGMTIKSQKEFEANVKAEELFTDDFVKSVSSVNLMDSEISKAGMVLSKNGAKPNVIISETDDGWNITGINVE